MQGKSLRVACLLIGAGALALAARHVDWGAAARSVNALGFRGLLIALPVLLAASCDALAWRASFEPAHAAQVGVLWRIRVATDAVFNSMPAGPALGEALRVILLKR